MIALYFVNILVLLLLQYIAPDQLFEYPSPAIRTADNFLGFAIVSAMMVLLLYFVKMEYERQKKRAIRSDKLKSAFLANMSHEIRTPMNAIIGFSQLLGMKDNSADMQKYTDTIQKNSENLLRLVNDIIDLSKIEAGDMKLPLMDGYQTTEEIKSMNPEITVIAQSAFAMVGDKEKAIKAGCDNYLAKPLDLNKLQDLIRKYMSS
jgi:signal transduction histidine kinase